MTQKQNFIRQTLLASCALLFLRCSHVARSFPQQAHYLGRAQAHQAALSMPQLA
jgi:hypothetical protein